MPAADRLVPHPSLPANDTRGTSPPWSGRLHQAWESDRDHGPSVLDALAATDAESGPEHIARSLRALGAQHVQLTLTPRKRPGGHASIRWLQEGRQRTAEGSTLDVAFRRAQRTLSRGSGGTG